MKHSISFFFPYREVSGCPVLFLNIAREIVQRTEWDVYIVDYNDGYMASSLESGDDISLIEFKDGVKCNVKTDYLVMQAYLPEAIRPELSISHHTKVLFWMLHPMNYLPIVFPFNFFHGYVESNLDTYSSILKVAYRQSLKKAQNFFDYTSSHRMSVMMNSTDIPALEKMLSIKVNNPKIIPIASSDPTLRKSNYNVDTLRLGWIGRLCDFKITVLNYTIQKARQYADDNKINTVFHVIGDGELAHILDTKGSDYFCVKSVGALSKEYLDKYIDDNIDINFAMGTSVIESAKLAVPSVKLDFSYGEIPDGYIFNWFHDSAEFDVGHVISDSELEVDNKSFDRIISDYLKNPAGVGDKSYCHYASQFSLKSVTDILLNQLLGISTDWGDLPQIYKRLPLSRKLYYKLKYHI